MPGHKTESILIDSVPVYVQPDPYAIEREKMVEEQLFARGIRDEGVLAAMRRIPRHEFVSEDYRKQAYEDHPIPIAESQTISQPFIVALMLESLSLQGSDKCLEVGTGSGYVTAILAELTSNVYSIERHERLAREGAATLSRLGYNNITLKVGDGSQGLPDSAPFDVIVVSAAAPAVPLALITQLAEGGRMVIPVGTAERQELQLITNQEGKPLIRHLEGCRFVPLIAS